MAFIQSILNLETLLMYQNYFKKGIVLIINIPK